MSEQPSKPINPLEYLAPAPHDLSDPSVVVVGGTYEVARQWLVSEGYPRRRNVFSIEASATRMRGLRSPKVVVVSPWLAKSRQAMLDFERELIALDASVTVVNY